LVKWPLWDGSNLVKALIHQTTAIVASLVTIHSVNLSLSFSQGSKRIFSFAPGRAGGKKAGDSIPIILVDITFFPVIFRYSLSAVAQKGDCP
jgi:hypothetical protein